MKLAQIQASLDVVGLIIGFWYFMKIGFDRLNREYDRSIIDFDEKPNPEERWRRFLPEEKEIEPNMDAIVASKKSFFDLDWRLQVIALIFVVKVLLDFYQAIFR